MALSWLPRTPAEGDLTPPVDASTSANGAGGNRNARDGGYVMRTMTVVRISGMTKLKIQATT